MAQLEANYFDGKSSRSQAVLLEPGLQGTILVKAQDGLLICTLPAGAVQWPERTRHGARIAQLPDGASLQSRDAGAWDDWVAQHAVRESMVVRAQQSWRGVAVAAILLVSGFGTFYLWGLPAVAQAIVTVVPHSVDVALGRTALEQVEKTWMKPSQLSEEVRDRLSGRFARAVRLSHGGNPPPYQLLFRQSTIGPNAFALPGGTMVMTDELVDLLKDDEVVMGVLGHELGHVTHRHGMRQLVQVTALQTALSAAFGDYASIIAYAPLVLGTMGYSREHERQADAESVAFMRAAGISPRVMVRFFEAVRAEQKTRTKSSPLGISIVSSHPGDEERVRFFTEAR
jgi:Zn-dependent protease with chaperone function